MANIKDVEKWLKSMGIKTYSKVTVKDKRTGQQISAMQIPIGYKLPDGNNLLFLTNIAVIPNWITSKCLLIPPEVVNGFSNEQKQEFLQLLLKANFDLFEVTYSMDPNGAIFVEADSPENVAKDDWKKEYEGILFGIKYFIEQILPGIAGLQPTSTYNEQGVNEGMYV